MYFFLLLLITGLLSQLANSEKLVDPTRPFTHTAGAAANQPQALQLQAIFWGDGRKEAIINGKSVQEGDHVEGKKIIRIRENEVVYVHNGAQHVLKLRSSFLAP